MSKSELENTGEKIIMGVGEGGGNLFVEGDYASITLLQSKLFELEELREENKRLKKKIKILQYNEYHNIPKDSE
jgi:hypothetical protein